MNKMTLLILLGIVFGTVQAATIHVPANYSTIQAGIDASVNGDIVLVAPGTYVENIRFNGKAITLKSAQGPEVTVIDGGSPADPDFGSAILLMDGETFSSSVQGFTISQGTGTKFGSSSLNKYGGGICCYDTSPYILDNIITGNTADYGGGIYSSKTQTLIYGNRIEYNLDAGAGGGFYGTATIQNCHIEGNTAYSGGGLGMRSAGNVTNNYFTKNSCERTGGAMFINMTFGLNINNNYFYDNSAERGAAIGCSDNGNATVKNNVFRENRSTLAGGVFSIDNYYSSVTSSGNQFIWNRGGDLGGVAHTRYYFKSTNDLYYRNSASWGGAVHNSGFGDVSISNATFLLNFAHSCGSIYSSTYQASNFDIVNSIFWDNYAEFIDEMGNYDLSNLQISYSNVKGGQSSMDGVYTWGAGMIDQDPLFADPSRGDVHLTYDSPCKDAGDNGADLLSIDFDGDPRTTDGIVDMGADEFHDRLYIIGEPNLGNVIDVKMVGVPNTAPVFLWVGTGVQVPAISTGYGLWHLQLPVALTIPIGALPASGSFGFQVYINPTIPVGDVPIQALIGNSLTNLCVISIR